MRIAEPPDTRAGAAALAQLTRRLHATPVLIVAAVGAAGGDVLGGAGSWLAPLVLVTGAVATALLAWHRTPLWRRVAVGVVACAGAAVAAQRVYRPTFGPDHVAAAPMPAPVRIEGVLAGDIDAGNGRARVALDVGRIAHGSGWQATHGKLLLTVQQAQRSWQAGDRIEARLRLRRPRNFGNPREFDYEAYLARRGIYVTAYAQDDTAFRLLERAERGVTGWLARWRRDVGGLFRRTLPGPEAAVLGALIIGRDDPQLRELRAAFNRAGVSHVLSISGLHVGLVAAGGYALFRWGLARSQWLLLAASVPKLAVGASVLPVLFYAGIAGGSVATVRSVVMILVLLVGVAIDRQRQLLVSLAAAALLIIVVSPGATLDISFQLSFVAVLGLVYGAERFWPWWRQWEERRLLRLHGGWRAPLWRLVAGYAIVSVSAVVATAPLTAWHFNQISLVAVVANALIVPLLGSVAVTLGLVAAGLERVWEPAAALCVLLAWPALRLGIWLVQTIAALPGAAIRVVTPTAFELGLAYAALFMLVRWPGGARRWGLVLLVVVAAGDAAWWYLDRYHRRDLRITFLSIGQGDSTVVELPGAEVMVIDGGGLGGGLGGDSFDVGERVVAPFLWSRKIAHIDYLVLSHPDWDHYGGLAFLAAHFTPREFWWHGPPTSPPRLAALLEMLAARGVPRVTLRRGERRRLGAVEAVVHSPPSRIEGLKDNDQSLVLGLAYGATRVLFTGDIEAAGEASLVAAADGRLASTVLKVPHHGSRTSSSARFVDAVAPEIAVVSAGFENRYRFPHPDVVRRYAAQRSTVMRTDLDGAVHLHIDAHGRVDVRRSRGP